MPDDRIELKVGAAIVIALVGLVVGLLWIKDYEIGEEKYKFEVLFDNVGGLDPGDPVAISGVDRGDVESVRLANGGVVVTLALNAGASVPDDSEVRIESIGLMGEKFISIYPGRSGRAIQPGERIQGSFSMGLPEAVASLGEVLQKISDIADEIQQSILDEELTTSIRMTVTEAEETFKELKVTARNLSSSTGEIREVFDGRGRRMGGALDDFETAAATLDTVARDLSKVSASLKNLMGKIEQGEGSLGKLVNEPELYDQLKQTAEEVDKLVTDIRRNPKRYLHIDIF
jgi:phospholipid/cholesterol/gamma-HCH transport system substrate-binding protein